MTHDRGDSTFRFGERSSWQARPCVRQAERCSDSEVAHEAGTREPEAGDRSQLADDRNKPLAIATAQVSD
jgi:hypothetical protein